MALKRNRPVEKPKPQPTENKKEELSGDDIKFILAKLKSATYTGTEFETFYSVWQKLSAKLTK